MMSLGKIIYIGKSKTKKHLTLKRIHELLADIDRHGNKGIGKPEALKHDLSGCVMRNLSLQLEMKRGKAGIVGTTWDLRDFG